jgi:hypothetical protein
MAAAREDAATLSGSIDETTSAQERLNSEMQMTAEGAAIVEESIRKIGDGAKYTQQELQIVGQIGQATGAVLAGIFAGNIGEMAKWKAEQNAIMAAEHFAMAAASALIPGLQGEVAGHIAAAKMFLGVAAAWAALAGATGGFSSSGGGAGRGGPRDTGGAASERAGPAGPEVHIYLEGHFDALNPTVQRVVNGAIREAQQTYGPNAQTYIHKRSRGR